MIIPIIIVIITIIFKLYQYIQISKEKSNKLNKNTLILKNNLLEFERNISKTCKNKDCHISYQIVNNVKDLINEKGMEYTLHKIRSNKHYFMTNENESVFIITKDYENNNFFMYHYLTDFDNNSLISIQNKIKEKYCYSKLCDINRSVNDFFIFANRNKEGFYIHNWFSEVKQDAILKKTYIKKLSNIKTRFGKKDILICCSSEILKTKEIDPISIIIYLIGLILFMFFWFIFDIRKILKNDFMAIVIFYIIFSIYIFNIINFQINYESEDAIQKSYIESIETSISIAGVGLALSIFFFKLLKIKHKINNEISIKLLSFSVIFSVLSFIELRLKKNIQNFNRKIVLKEVLQLNSIAFLLITICLYN